MSESNLSIAIEALQDIIDSCDIDGEGQKPTRYDGDDESGHWNSGYDFGLAAQAEIALKALAMILK